MTPPRRHVRYMFFGRLSRAGQATRRGLLSPKGVVARGNVSGSRWGRGSSGAGWTSRWKETARPQKTQTITAGAPSTGRISPTHQVQTCGETATLTVSTPPGVCPYQGLRHHAPDHANGSICRRRRSGECQTALPDGAVRCGRAVAGLEAAAAACPSAASATHATPQTRV